MSQKLGDFCDKSNSPNRIARGERKVREYEPSNYQKANVNRVAIDVVCSYLYYTILLFGEQTPITPSTQKPENLTSGPSGVVIAMLY